MILSVTFTQRGNDRTLSGQTVAAFWNSIAHANPFGIGINCSMGAEDLRPRMEELADIAPVFTHCYPNAGLPNPLGEFDETPEHTARVLGEFADAGWLNLAGGCCGTTPEHIAAIHDTLADRTPREARLRSLVDPPLRARAAHNRPRFKLYHDR